MKRIRSLGRESEADDGKESVVLKLPSGTAIPDWWKAQNNCEVASIALRIGAAAIQFSKDAACADSLQPLLKTSIETALDAERRVFAAKETTHSTILATKDEMIADLQRRLLESQTFQASIDMLRESSTSNIASMKEMFDSTRLLRANSTQKGQEGEYAFFSLLSKAFGTAKDVHFEDVSKTASAGDIRMLFMGLHILWDPKAHEAKTQARVAAVVRNIPSSDVEKLKSNVREKGADVGIIVGLWAGVSNHSGNILEIEDGSETFIYINRLLLSEDPIIVLQSLNPLFQLLAARKTNRVKTGETDISKRIQTVADMLNTQIVKFEAKRKNLEQIRKTVEASFKAFASDLKSWEEDHRAAIESFAL